MHQCVFDKVRLWVAELLANRLPKHCHYHNLQHTLDVFEAARRYAMLEGIDDEEQRLLLTAALFHDIGFTESVQDNERFAVEICRRNLPGFNYSPDQIERIGRIILATRMPQQPEDRLEQIICDADLDYLGRNDYFALSDDLRREWSTLGRMISERTWLEDRIAFLKHHRYFLASARALRDEGKAQNLRRAQAELDEFLARGGGD